MKIYWTSSTPRSITRRRLGRTCPLWTKYPQIYAKNLGSIFGGFTSKSWKPRTATAHIHPNSNQYTYYYSDPTATTPREPDSKALIFSAAVGSLKVSPIHPSYTNNAIDKNDNWGPCFGSDIAVKNMGMVTFTPSGHYANSGALDLPRYQQSIIEMEVFQVSDVNF